MNVKKLKSLRLSREMRQAEFAEILCISPSQYSKLETGKAHISLHHIELLASNLNLDFHTLYDFLSEKDVSNEPSIIGKSEAVDKTGGFLSLNIFPDTLRSAINEIRSFCHNTGVSININPDGQLYIDFKQAIALLIYTLSI